jgi:hypothetical protein
MQRMGWNSNYSRSLSNACRQHRAVATRNPTSSPGRYAGMDNGWSLSLIDLPLGEFNKSIVMYPNIKRFPGGASNDMIPNLQNPENPLPYDPIKLPNTIHIGD